MLYKSSISIFGVGIITLGINYVMNKKKRIN